MVKDELWEDVPDSSVEFLDKAENLPSEERREIQQLAEAIQQKEAAEGTKERHKKMRVLYQRAPEDSLPFIIYCVYIGIWGGVTLTRLPGYTGEKLRILGLLLALVMILPIFVLPLKSWKSTISSLKSKLPSVED